MQYQYKFRHGILNLVLNLEIFTTTRMTALAIQILVTNDRDSEKGHFCFTFDERYSLILTLHKTTYIQA